MANFPCIQCGLCCRNISKVEWLAEYNDGTGVCVYLRGNKCAIYGRRPVCCNAEAMFDLFFRNNMSEQEYIVKNLEICHILNDAAQNEENCEQIKKIISGAETHSQKEVV